MNRETFQSLPQLLTLRQAAACGYTIRTIQKYLDAEVLRAIQPSGCTERRVRKLQLAQMLGWEDPRLRSRWQREKPLLTLGAVKEWTGYGVHQIAKIVAAGGLRAVQPGGLGRCRYAKEDVAEWLGLSHFDGGAKP